MEAKRKYKGLANKLILYILEDFPLNIALVENFFKVFGEALIIISITLEWSKF